MSPAVQAQSPPFVDRRNEERDAPGVERRQFANSHNDLSPPAQELAKAVDDYKLRHRRRYVNYEEMLAIVLELGYRK